MINPFAAIAVGTCGVCRFFYCLWNQNCDPLLYFLLIHVVEVHGHI